MGESTATLVGICVMLLLGSAFWGDMSLPSRGEVAEAMKAQRAREVPADPECVATWNAGVPPAAVQRIVAHYSWAEGRTRIVRDAGRCVVWVAGDEARVLEGVLWVEAPTLVPSIDVNARADRRGRLTILR